MRNLLPFMLLALAPLHVEASEITRIWLTHKSSDPSKIVVNWLSDKPGDSVVRFGPAPEYGNTTRINKNTTLHHVKILLEHPDTDYHYEVRTGEQQSVDAVSKTYPTGVLRVAVVANLQSKPKLSAISGDDVHLLLTAGDPTANLWQLCDEGKKGCLMPYAEIDRRLLGIDPVNTLHAEVR